MASLLECPNCGATGGDPCHNTEWPARVVGTHRERLWVGIAADACQCYPCSASDEQCICPRDERVLRAYIAQESIRPMEPIEREWCLQEIDSVEGYDRSDFEGECDGGLARGVLNAWSDFCRDKGLL